MASNTDVLRKLSEAQNDALPPEEQETRLIAHDNFGHSLDEFCRDDSSREADLSVS